MTGRGVVADGAACNTTHMATVALAMAAPEQQARLSTRRRAAVTCLTRYPSVLYRLRIGYDSRADRLRCGDVRGRGRPAATVTGSPGGDGALASRRDALRHHGLAGQRQPGFRAHSGASAAAGVLRTGQRRWQSAPIRRLATP